MGFASLSKISSIRSLPSISGPSARLKFTVSDMPPSTPAEMTKRLTPAPAYTVPTSLISGTSSPAAFKSSRKMPSKRCSPELPSANTLRRPLLSYPIVNWALKVTEPPMVISMGTGPMKIGPQL